MPRKTITKKASSPAKTAGSPTSLDEIGEFLGSVGAAEETVGQVLDYLRSNFDVVNIGRVDKLSVALTKWIAVNTSVDGSYACTGSELILALQHVQNHIFDMMRPRKTAERLVEAVMEELGKTMKVPPVGAVSTVSTASTAAADTQMYR